MLTLAEHLEQKFGSEPAIDVACPCCHAQTALFALTRDEQLRWRCGHCRLTEKRIAEPEGYALTWEDIRGERGMRLSRCDWTQLPDAQATMSEQRREDWLAYRQALRDVTSQQCAPSEVAWPAAPDLPAAEESTNS